MMTWQAWVYFGAGFGLTAGSVVAVHRANPAILAQRGKAVTDSPWWDKALLGVFWLLNFFVIYFIAGLELKHDPEGVILFWIGMVLSIAAAVIAIFALAVNPYLESTARIQTERGQTVISAGVYGVVRHPTYSAVLLSCLGISFVFATLFVCITALVIAVLIIVRTSLEDKMLGERLPGYLEYAQKTRYRLVPYIW